MTHPNPSTLALFASQDLGRFARWRTERHLAGCRECRDEVESFAALSDSLVELNEMPAISWNRLSSEMKANIRLGLAAGECVRSPEPAGGPLMWFSSARALTACASLLAMVAAGLYLERPSPKAPPVIAHNTAVLRATATGIELNQDGQTLSLLHVRGGNVTYAAGAQGSMRAGYVDSETGNVTVNDVYVQ